MHHAFITAMRHALDRTVNPSGLPTPFSGLDECTGGLLPGQVWAITGHAGSGKSVLAAQLAGQAAVAEGVVVVLATLRDPEHRAWDRLLACTGRIALPGPLASGSAPSTAQTVSAADGQRQRAERRLTAAPLWLTTQPTDLPIDGPIADEVLPRTRLLVVDDMDQIAPSLTAAFLQHLASWARRQHATVVVTAAPGSVYAREPAAPYGARLRSPWRDHVDLVAEIRWADQDERPAETRLELLRNRSGPAQTIPLLFWGHQAQFVQR